MPRDVDQIIGRLRVELPGIEINQLRVNHAADDDGIWFIKIPEVHGDIQLESSSGNCPFLIESDFCDRLYGRTVEEVIKWILVLSARNKLKREFDAEEGSFLLQARCEPKWDWNAFRRLTSAMYDVADEIKGQTSIETWIANGFWFCDTWIKDWTSHPNFPRPAEGAYRDAIELIHDLASLLFFGMSPYTDDTLRKRAKGEPNSA